MHPRDRLAFPLDVPDLGTARRWITRLNKTVGVFKVGLELFTREGPASVEAVRRAGAQCFLDLKVHDIPSTMERAVENAIRLRVDYLTVHASAGPEALRAAAAVAKGTSTRLLGVTVLTSLESESLRAIGWNENASEIAEQLAAMAYQAGIRGFVSSPHECAALRKRLGPYVLLVTPGVRPQVVDDDQRRTATPEEALASGADLLVVGRPIRDAADPVAAAKAIVDTIARAGQ